MNDDDDDMRLSHLWGSEVTTINPAQLKAHMSEQQWEEQKEWWSKRLNLPLKSMSLEDLKKNHTFSGPLFYHGLKIIKKGEQWADPFFKSIIIPAGSDANFKIAQHAVRDAKIEALSYIIKHQPQWIQGVDSLGESLLHTAASLPAYQADRALTMSLMLMGAGCDIQFQNEKGETALMLCIESFKPELVRALLSAGAKINRKNKKGRSLIAYLLPGPPSMYDLGSLMLDQTSDEYRAEAKAKEELVAQSKRDLVEKLLELGLDTSELSSKKIQTALVMKAVQCWAAERNDPKILIRLIEHQAQLEAKLGQGTPLENLKGEGAPKEPLKSTKASKPSKVLMPPLGSGLDQALLMAASSSNWDVVMELIKRGADINAVGPLFDLASSKPSDWANNNKCWGLIHHLAYKGQMELLLEWITAPWASHWKTDILTQSGSNLWHFLLATVPKEDSFSERRLKSLQELLKIKDQIAPLNQQSETGQTPLLSFLSQPPKDSGLMGGLLFASSLTVPPNKEVLELLLKHGADATDINFKQESCLYQVLSHDYPKASDLCAVIDPLLEAGAGKYINTSTRSGESLVDIVIHRQNVEVLDRFLGCGLELFVPEEKLAITGKTILPAPLKGNSSKNGIYSASNLIHQPAKANWFSNLIETLAKSFRGWTSSINTPSKPLKRLTALEKLDAFALIDKGSKNEDFNLRFKEIYAIQKERDELAKMITSVQKVHSEVSHDVSESTDLVNEPSIQTQEPPARRRSRSL